MFHTLVKQYVEMGWIRPWIQELGIQDEVERLFVQKQSDLLVHSDRYSLPKRLCVQYLEGFCSHDVPSYVLEFGSGFRPNPATGVLDESRRLEIAELIIQYVKDRVTIIRHEIAASANRHQAIAAE